MTLRNYWSYSGKRYLGNTNTNEVHDLEKEKPGCKIDDIRVQHIKMFVSFEDAKKEKFDNCAHCIGGSRY